MEATAHTRQSLNLAVESLDNAIDQLDEVQAFLKDETAPEIQYLAGLVLVHRAGLARNATRLSAELRKGESQ